MKRQGSASLRPVKMKCYAQLLSNTRSQAGRGCGALRCCCHAPQVKPVIINAAPTVCHAPHVSFKRVADNAKVIKGPKLINRLFANAPSSRIERNHSKLATTVAPRAMNAIPLKVPADHDKDAPAPCSSIGAISKKGSEPEQIMIMEVCNGRHVSCKRAASTTAELHNSAPSTTRATAHAAFCPASAPAPGEATSSHAPAKDTSNAKLVDQLIQRLAANAAMAATIRGSNAIMAPRVVPLTEGAAMAARRLKQEVSNTPTPATFSQDIQLTPPWRNAPTTHGKVTQAATEYTIVMIHNPDSCVTSALRTTGAAPQSSIAATPQVYLPMSHIQRQGRCG